MRWTRPFVQGYFCIGGWRSSEVIKHGKGSEISLNYCLTDAAQFRGSHDGPTFFAGSPSPAAVPDIFYHLGPRNANQPSAGQHFANTIVGFQ